MRSVPRPHHLRLGVGRGDRDVVAEEEVRAVRRVDEREAGAERVAIKPVDVTAWLVQVAPESDDDESVTQTRTSFASQLRS